MKEEIKKYWWIIIIVLIFGEIVFEEIKSSKETTRFCKEQCKYSPYEKGWRLDLRSVFQENGINEQESSMKLEKIFSEKDLDVCIKYCKRAGEYLRDLQLR